MKIILGIAIGCGVCVFCIVALVAWEVWQDKRRDKALIVARPQRPVCRCDSLTDDIAYDDLTTETDQALARELLEARLLLAITDDVVAEVVDA